MNVFIVFDWWGSDPKAVCAVFPSKEDAELFVSDCLEQADDYEQARHMFEIQKWPVGKENL